MKTTDYVIINNRAYDPITGLPVEGVAVNQPQPPVATKITSAPRINRGVATPNVHRTAEHSQTLSRRYVKKPTVISPIDAQTNSQPIVAAYSPMSLQQFTVKKAETINKFTHAAPTVAAVKRQDRPAEAHPLTRRAAGRTLDIAAPRRQRAATQQKLDSQARLVSETAKQQPRQKDLKSAHVLKNEAIFEAMNKEVAHQKRTRTKKQRSSGRWARFMTLASASFAIILLAGYFTYLNMPNLSIKMAAVQSGVDAKYPGYSPDGYALSGPISFKEGEVSMRFAYADGGRDFTLTQKRSNWDSSAVRQYIDKHSQSATTTQVDGLTIYSYSNNAAWVNGGVLYTLEGDAPLSSDQIQRIATSM